MFQCVRSMRFPRNMLVLTAQFPIVPKLPCPNIQNIFFKVHGANSSFHSAVCQVSNEMLAPTEYTLRMALRTACRCPAWECIYRSTDKTIPRMLQANICTIATAGCCSLCGWWRKYGWVEQMLLRLTLCSRLCEWVRCRSTAGRWRCCSGKVNVLTSKYKEKRAQMALYGTMFTTAALEWHSARKLDGRFCHRWHSAVLASCLPAPSAGSIVKSSAEAKWQSK